MICSQSASKLNPYKTDFGIEQNPYINNFKLLVRKLLSFKVISLYNNNS